MGNLYVWNCEERVWGREDYDNYTARMPQTLARGIV
jgi:hypothetical protein